MNLGLQIEKILTQEPTADTNRVLDLLKQSGTHASKTYISNIRSKMKRVGHLHPPSSVESNGTYYDSHVEPSSEVFATNEEITKVIGWAKEIGGIQRLVELSMQLTHIVEELS